MFVLRFAYLLALAVWVGGVAFFSFGVAPSVFGGLPREAAGQAIGAIFPTYYVFGYIAGALVTVLGAFVWRGTPRWHLAQGAISASMLVATLIAGLWIQPRAAALRAELHRVPSNDSAKVEFDRLHGRAVQLNGWVLLGGLVLLGGAASRLETRRT